MHFLHTVTHRITTLLSAPRFLSLLTIINGLWLIAPIVRAYGSHIDWRTHGFTEWLQSLGFIQLLDLPRFSLGIILIGLGISLSFRSRIAWLFSALILLLLILIDISMGEKYLWHALYSITLLVLLLHAWRGFSNHSTTNTSAIALFSIAVLAAYSVLGTLYLGDHYKPKIDDPFTALYFSMISMATVGYGDIVPVTVESRMFTISIVVFGITIFTTSVVYIAGALVRDTQEIVQKRLLRMKNHYVIVGTSMLAQYVYQGLRKRKMNVVVVCPEDKRSLFPTDAAVVTGEMSSITTLDQASVKDARCVMALEENDAENTYILLAVNETVADNVKTVTIINEESNRKKIGLLRADFSFSLTELGGEILMRVLNGENIDSTMIGELLIGHTETEIEQTTKGAAGAS
ncbi:MAG TPA: ion channel [Paenalcaligenes sp.]|nr:ion channel [Paenalcaligenes sp.]